MLMLNEDCNHFAYSRTPDEMTPEGVDALVDRYAKDTRVTDLLFNVNGMRSSVPSAVKQVFWDGFDPEAGDDQSYFAHVPDYERPIIRKWVGNMLLMEQRGIDPYARWLARGRALGVRGWISVRMNDIHCVDVRGHMMHDRIWEDHPEYWRELEREFESPIDRALDYGHAAVREHYLAYIRELAERYDMDGLELDFMRQPYNFRAGHEAEGATLMTALVRQVREMTQARGVRLAVRVPGWPETARRLGLDAAAWAREGLIDHLIISSIFSTCDNDMPVEEWKAQLYETKVALLTSLEYSLSPFPQARVRPHTTDTLRGTAAGYLDRGADGLYLFNFMDRAGVYVSDALLHTATHLTVAGAEPRRHILTFTDSHAPGEPQRVRLPQAIQRYGYRPSAEFRLPTGPSPLDGQPVELRIGLEIADQPPVFGRYALYMGRLMHIETEPLPDAVANQLIVRVNGTVCPFARPLIPDAESGATHAYTVPPGALHRGDNVIEVSNPTDLTAQAVWVEIAVG